MNTKVWWANKQKWNTKQVRHKAGFITVDWNLNCSKEDMEKSAKCQERMIKCAKR